jgi:MYXO-CTERM domain-containing protein
MKLSASPLFRALLVLVAAVTPIAAQAAPIKVAVIGPQHVHSHQLTYDKEFPAMLQVLLGPEYKVENFGDCCASILRGYPRQKETHPYLEGGESYPAVGGMNFHDSIKFVPDVVLIAPFGKHDRELAMQLYGGKLDRAKLEIDYEALVTTYLDLPGKPKVYVSTPIPIPYGSPSSVVTEVMLPAVQAVIAKHKLPFVDFHAMFLDHKELFKDDTHVTNDKGLHTLADGFFALMKSAPAAADAGAAGDAAPLAADASPSPPADAAATPTPATGGAGGTGGGGTGGRGGQAGAAEPPDEEPTSSAPRSSGCGVGGAGPGSLALPGLALAALVARRRRQARRP